MSLHYSQSTYTPVFPPLHLRRPLSSSPELSSAPHRPSNIVSTLSQFHLSLASLPAELSPATYSESETGANAHRLKIEAAYKDAEGQPSNGDWSRLSKLVEMTCTRSKFRNSKAQIVRNDIGEDVPWILAETEEEWQEWERAWKQRKAKNKTPRAQVNRETISQLEDKDVNSSPNKSHAISEKVSSWKTTLDMSTKNSVVDKRQKNNSDLNRPSTLGFPVVKTSYGASTKKKKTVLTKGVSEAAQTTSDSFPSLTNGGPKDKPILSVSSNSPMPPPTFSQVVISTPVKRKSTIKDSLPLFFSSQTSPEHSREYQPLFDAPHTSPSIRPLFEPSQMSPRKEGLDILRSDPVEERTLPATSNKRNRLSTPSVVEDKDAPILQTQAMFDTQEVISRSSKRPRTVPRSPVSTPALSPPNIITPVKTSSTDVLSSPKRMHITPSRSLGRGLGNAKGLFDTELNPANMSTPEKKLPTLTELLASSQRSKPRPRPPSKKRNLLSTSPSKSKSPIQQAFKVLDEKDVVDTIQDDIPPSPKTFFSSPASSSSSSRSDASPFNFLSKKARFSPPRSPLFTQHPEAFDPPATGTQIDVNDDELGRGLQAEGLGRTDSLGILGYNSQFDVDGHVDDFRAMLEKDVDIDNWYKELQSQDQISGGNVDVFD